MTLGKKLSGLRRQLGMTQQQLGEHLNLSAQAVSKWENDLAEPDLTTLRALANLYKVSIDELLDTGITPKQAGVPAIDTEAVSATVRSAIGEQMKQEKKTLGFCTACGISITEENLGTSDPVFKCKKCVAAENALKARQLEAKKRAEEEENLKRKRQFVATQAALKSKRLKSLIIGGLVALIPAFLFTVALVNSFDLITLRNGIVFTYALFAFTVMMFYDTPVQAVVAYMCSASITWPGVIFTFDLDGFIFLIAIKLLFALLGFLFGLACTILGFIIGLIIAPFVFPFIMVRVHKDIKYGRERI